MVCIIDATRLSYKLAKQSKPSAREFFAMQSYKEQNHTASSHICNPRSIYNYQESVDAYCYFQKNNLNPLKS